MFRIIIKPVGILLIVSFVLLDFSVQSAKAQMIDTHAVIEQQQQDETRMRISAFLAREDVQQIMIRNGVDAGEAQERVNSLSDTELTEIARNMDQLPAGGSAIGTIVGAAVLIFLVLLITDILGFTHVFSFVNHPR
jgi:predicted ATP-grasp superfamily ATP-dependent carboligase